MMRSFTDFFVHNDDEIPDAYMGVNIPEKIGGILVSDLAYLATKVHNEELEITTVKDSLQGRMDLNKTIKI